MCAKKNLPHPILLDLGCSIKKKTCIQNYTERMKMTRRNKYTATMASWVSAFPPLDGWRTRLIHGRLLLALFQFKASKPLKAKRRRAAQQHVHITDATIPVLRPGQLLTYVIIYTFQQKNVQKLCTLFKGYISARLQAWTNRIGRMETNFSFQSLNKAKNITRFNNK